MIRKVLFFILCFCFIPKTYSQEVMRSTLSNMGSSSNFTDKENYIVQQSVGQLSVTGTFQSENYNILQGFIRPSFLSAEIIKEDTNVNALIFPNPFQNQVSISFSTVMDEPLNIFIYDMLGRVVYSEQQEASQKIHIVLNNLANASYIINIISGEKHFKATIIKNQL